VCAMAAEAMAQAILNAVRNAESAYGYPGYREVLERRRKSREKSASGAER